MKVGIIGCGYVADMYVTTVQNHLDLEIVIAHDKDPAAADRFQKFHGIPVAKTLEEVLNINSIELILNLTNPHSHYAVSKACLLAGKNVYSEKPLAMSLADAVNLVEVSKRNGVQITSAPCSYLGEAAQSIRCAIEAGKVGDVRLVYAEMEDSVVFFHDHRSWKSTSGAVWPAEDEFAVGATLEHAGYYITWLCALFGPVRSITSFSTLCYTSKGTDQNQSDLANDLSVSCLTFDNKVVARLTCGLVAPVDRSLHVFGTEGMITLNDGWDYNSRPYLRSNSGKWETKPAIIGRLLDRMAKDSPFKHWMGSKLPIKPSHAILPKYPSRMDFARGPSTFAKALTNRCSYVYGAEFSAHVTEIALIAQHADQHQFPYKPVTTFERSQLNGFF